MVDRYGLLLGHNVAMYGRQLMSALVFAKDCETILELEDWIQNQIPTARILTIDGEITIKTGLEMSMGGYLNQIGEEE